MERQTASSAAVIPIYWEKLSLLDPTDVCNRTEGVYHPTRQGFVLPVWNRSYLILPRERKIMRMIRNTHPVEEEVSFFLSLTLLVYLIEAKDMKPTYTWVSEKDLKGGSTFFRGPHRLDVSALEATFGRDPDGFLRAGMRLGGSEVLFGDKGFSLDVLPKVPLAYVLWKGDEEFPPKVTVLFDSTVEAHLPLDIIWCMVGETSRCLMEGKQTTGESTPSL